MKAGVHIMPATEYHADPCDSPSLSSSIARLILTHSPLHGWTAHPRLNPNFVSEEKTTYDLGSASHAMLLEGGAGLEIINPENYRSKPTKANPLGNVPAGWTNEAIREARDAARLAGKTPVLPSDMADIEAMVKIARQAIANCSDLSGLTLADGTAEQVLLWQEDGGVWCRARPDWMSHDRRVQISYKSTAASANPNDYVRTGLGIGFDLQNAFYLRGNRATGGPQDGVSLTLVQENSPPYACSWIGLDPAFAALADEKCEEAIELWRRCMAAGRWPGYSPRVHWLEPPAWATSRWEERGPMSERAGGLRGDAAGPGGKMLPAADMADGVPL